MRESHIAVPRVVIAPDLDWTALLITATLSIFRWRGYFIRSRMQSFPARLIIRLSRMKPILLEECDWIPLSDLSFDEPGQIALANVESWSFVKNVPSVGLESTQPVDIQTGLRIAMLKELSMRAPDALTARLWYRALGAQKRKYIASSYWDRYVVSSRDMPVGVIASHLPVRLPAKVMRAALRRLASSGRLRRNSAVAGSPEPYFAGSLSVGSADSAAECLFVLNQGMQFGNLYAYDQWFDEDPASPLHPERVAYLSPSGGQNCAGRVAKALPRRRPSLRSYLEQVRLWRKTRTDTRATTPAVAHWTSIGHLLAAREAAAVFRTNYPRARLAIYAYEIQVSPVISMAFQLAEIPTLATLERALVSEVAIAPFAVDILVTPGEPVDAALARNRALAIGTMVPLGYWRVDSLKRALTEDIPGAIATALTRGLHPVVVLPYHLSHDSRQAADAIATSRKSVEAFLHDVIALASLHPDCYFIIRGKNADWVQDEDMATTAKQIAGLSNIEVDTEYAILDQSYRLCSFADLILAKHTSLVDECLAAGIPCILHDYTPNSSNYAKPVLRYLRSSEWAQSRKELEALVARAIERIPEKRDADGVQSWVEVKPQLHLLAKTLISTSGPSRKGNCGAV